MSIEIHCDHCGKLIRAPETAAGKRGKCPYCDQSVYIPTPPDQIEEIGLAPVDEDDERRVEELRRESAEYAATISKAQPGKYDVGEAGGGKSAGGEEDIDISDEVELYVQAMADTKLDVADGAVMRLKKARKRAVDHVQGLLIDQMPPRIGKVPPQLIKGLLKKLAERLKE